MAKGKNNGLASHQGVTSGKQWRQHYEEGVLIQLPSGNWARLRPVDFGMIIKYGKLPDSLTPLVIEAFNGGNPEAKIEVNEADDLVSYMGLQDSICRCAFVEPKVVDNPTKDNEISVDHISDDDKRFVMSVLGASARDLESFRDEQIAMLESIRAGEGSQSETKSTAEPSDVDSGELRAAG